MMFHNVLRDLNLNNWKVKVHCSCIGIRLVLGMREYIVIGMGRYLGTIVPV